VLPNDWALRSGRVPRVPVLHLGLLTFPFPPRPAPALTVAAHPQPLNPDFLPFEGTRSPPDCPLRDFAPKGNANVMPTISGPNTLWWFNGLGAGVSGYANQITLTANSGGTGTSYQWAITAGSDKVSLSTSSSATVQVTSTGQSKTANDVSITVTVGGLTSNPFNLTVRAPYSLGQDPVHPTPVYAQDPEYVWNITIYNQILDNLFTPMPSPVSAGAPGAGFAPGAFDFPLSASSRARVNRRRSSAATQSLFSAIP
jgi:hypothetical protein